MGMPVAFFEVVSQDHERAQRFYAELFDWKVAADPDMGGYGVVDTGAGEGAIGGGIGPSEELGGQALVPPTDLPAGYGRFAVLADPDGNPVGLWG